MANSLHTPQRLKDNEIEWYCRNCDDWVLGTLINVTGYTDLVCEYCDTTLEYDYWNERNPNEELE